MSRIESKYKCILCRKTYNTRGMLEVHKNMHRITHSKHSRKIHCVFCRRQFNLCTNLVQHCKTLHGGEKKSFPHKRVRSQTVMTSSTSVKMCKTHVRANRICSYNKTDNKMGAGLDKSQNILKCDKCNIQFSRKYSLLCHQKRHHAEDVLPSHNKRENPKGSGLNKTPNLFQCLKCDKQFTRKNNLHQHQKVHLPNRTSHNMKRKSRVSGSKKNLKCFQCEKCNQTFTRKDSLLRHMELHLSIIKPAHKCEKCGQLYPSKEQLVSYQNDFSKYKHFIGFVPRNCESNVNKKECQPHNMDQLHVQGSIKPTVLLGKNVSALGQNSDGKVFQEATSCQNEDTVDQKALPADSSIKHTNFKCLSCAEIFTSCRGIIQHVKQYKKYDKYIIYLKTYSGESAHRNGSEVLAASHSSVDNLHVEIPTAVTSGPMDGKGHFESPHDGNCPQTGTGKSNLNSKTFNGASHQKLQPPDTTPDATQNPNATGFPNSDVIQNEEGTYPITTPQCTPQHCTSKSLVAENSDEICLPPNEQMPEGNEKESLLLGINDGTSTAKEITDGSSTVKELTSSIDTGGHSLSVSNGEQKTFAIGQGALTLQNNFESPRRGYIKCRLCGEIHSSHSHMIKHIKEAHLASDIHQPSDHTCYVCKKTFKSRRALMKHSITHEDGSHTCPDCGIVLKTAKLLTEHSRRHGKNNPLVCQMCGKCFPFQYYLDVHIRNVHTHDKPFKCPKCPSAYSTQKDLKKHSVKHTGIKQFQCHECGVCFVDNGTLRRHKKTVHATEKNYICEVCKKAFVSRNYLNKHRRLHNVNKPFRCGVCGQAFHVKETLKLHALIHTGEKNHKCSHCGRAFRVIGQLQWHMRTHTGEKPHKCAKCNMGFSQPGSLTRHMRTHTGETPYKCPTCGRTFTQDSALKRHQATHTGEKRYKCDMCDAVYSQSYPLVQHRRKKHPDQ